MAVDLKTLLVYEVLRDRWHFTNSQFRQFMLDYERKKAGR